MKYLTFFLLAGILGCRPSFTEESPFIVKRIYESGNNECIYYLESRYDKSINAPCGMFNIGDTINLCK